MSFAQEDRDTSECRAEPAHSRMLSTPLSKSSLGRYLLSLFLTADRERAEQCLVPGMDDCADGNAAFRDWVRDWETRIIIRNAIRMISPHPRQKVSTQLDLRTANNRCAAPESFQDAPIARILMLKDFERSVYILPALEGYSDRDCANLLGVSRDDIRESRRRALHQIGNAEEAHSR